MCGTRIKNFYFLFFILSIICYIKDVFSFSFIYFPIERSILTQKQNGQLIYYSNEFTNRFSPVFFWEIDVNWLFVIIKSYAVNFKERNNNNNNHHCQNNSQIFSVLLYSLEGHLLACFFFNQQFCFSFESTFFGSSTNLIIVMRNIELLQQLKNVYQVRYIDSYQLTLLQKQPSSGVLRKKCSENMQ